VVSLYKKLFHDWGGKAVLFVDNLCNKAFNQEFNPTYYHGALPNLFFWICAGSGIFLFLYYVPSLHSAFDSVQELTVNVPYGRVMRGIHRYGADAMLVAVILHMLRVWFTDRYRGWRWVQWVSGVCLLFFTLAVGVTGYLLIWDERALLITRITQDMLGGPNSYLSRLFIGGDIITDLTMSRFLFYHIAIPFLLFFLLWIHYIRVRRPVVYPPMPLTLMMFGIIFAVTMWLPATSMEKANLDVMPTNMLMDWFYLWGYWLSSLINPPIVLLGTLLVTAALFYMPWVIKEERERYSNVPRVIFERCIGCRLCEIDCHANAIVMVPVAIAPKVQRGKAQPLVAEVIPKRCAECGICVGACPVQAIELPLLSDKMVEQKVIELVQK